MCYTQPKGFTKSRLFLFWTEEKCLHVIFFPISVSNGIMLGFDSLVTILCI